MSGIDDVNTEKEVEVATVLQDKSYSHLQSVFCPQCGKHKDRHEDYVCDFRWYDDKINHDSGWIPGMGVACIESQELSFQSRAAMQAANLTDNELIYELALYESNDNKLALAVCMNELERRTRP